MTDQDPNGCPLDPFPPEGKVEAQLDLLERVFDNIPNPIFYKDMQGRFLGFNRAFEAASGKRRDELLGKTAFDVLTLAEATLVDGQEQELLDNGITQIFFTHVTRPEGGDWPVLVHKAVFRGPDGSVAGLVASIMDRDVHEKAERDLHHREMLLSTISRHVMDLMSIVDQTGKRLFTSPSYLSVLGYLPEELEALPPMGLIHPDDQQRVQETLTGLFTGRPNSNLEYRLRHRDGRWLHFESRGTLIQGASGRPAQALTVARDITARKNAERERKDMEVQLRHAQKLEAIGSLAAGIAHEINTPTQYIGDNAAFLKEALGKVMTFLAAQRRFLENHAHLPGLEEDAREALKQFEDLDLDYLTAEVPMAIQQTLDGVTRVGTIVKAMKEFSHPGGSEKTLTDLNQSIQNTVMVSRNEWKYVAELELDLDKGLPPVPCYQGEINQALLNLVVNAAHAIEETLGGRESGRMGLIRVATRRAGDEVVIEVADNGAGIPEGVLDRIFDPFFTTKPVGKGTGQGLAIVHSVVVDKHGGRVTVASTPGQGTTFQLFLPFLAKRPDAKALS